MVARKIISMIGQKIMRTSLKVIVFRNKEKKIKALYKYICATINIITENILFQKWDGHLATWDWSIKYTLRLLFGRGSQSKFVKGILILLSEECITYHKLMTYNFKIRKVKDCTQEKGMGTTWRQHQVLFSCYAKDIKESNEADVFVEIHSKAMQRVLLTASSRN